MHRRTLLISALAAPLAALPAWAAAPPMVVVKSPSCGCCGAWIAHIRAAGIAVEVRDVTDDDLWAIKARVGIPDDLASCHTAQIGDYLVEGHVPAADILRLLAEAPVAAGLAVPGMPIGSPGMEMGDEREPFDTVLFRRDGTTSVFASH